MHSGGLPRCLSVVINILRHLATQYVAPLRHSYRADCISLKGMRNVIFVLFAVIASIALSSEAASPRLTEKSVLETVKKNPHLKAYYSQDKKGNKVLVVTNRSTGRNKRTPRTAVVVPASRAKSVETLTRTPIRQEPQINRRTYQKGIPIVPNRNPQRPINPYKPVNPFKDPTAIPTTSSPDSDN